MAFKNRFFKLKLKLTDLKLKLKKMPSALKNKISSLDSETVKQALRSGIFAIKPLFLQTPLDLKEWTFKTTGGKLRCIILAAIVCAVFAMAGSFYTFTANDGFISFRYVANAVKGYGFVFNPPPFEPVSGYTSFLWLAVLRGVWAFGMTPPHSADIATFWLSMATIGLCFAFIRRMGMQITMQRKSLYLFLILCLVLVTNGTFLAFMTSGTEAALFNFLAVWWTFEATSRKSRNPVYLSVAAVLLALTRTEGIIFIPASALFLILFAFQGRSRLKCFAAFVLLGSIWFYYDWLNKTYGSYLPNSFSAFYNRPFPDFGRDYVLSFVLEYALYFWLIFFALWAFFKFVIRRQKGFAVLFLLLVTFCSYIGYYLFVMGGDVLEYRPFGFFIPLCTLAGIKMISENICGKVVSLAFIFLIYLLVSTAIPQAHRSLTKDLQTYRETAFLYRPVAEKTNWFGLFAKRFDEAQKNLIYQGIGLRHKEHKVLTEQQLKSFPSREEGKSIPKTDNRLFAWDFVGVAGWTLPEVIIIDTSGQNNLIVAQSPLKYPDRRLFGHERHIPGGYIPCFNGGSNLQIDPFSGKKNLRLLRAAPLSDGKIKGCESFWKTQVQAGARKAKSLHIKTR